MFTKYKILLLIILSSVILEKAKAQDYQEMRQYLRSYGTSTATTLNIVNKYGKVSILQWDKDSVSIKVDITVRSKDSTKLRSIISSIEVEFQANQYYISAKTVIGKNLPPLLFDLQNIAQILTASDSQVTINYTINAPSYINIVIDNKYGDVFANNIRGSFNLTLSNGDFKVNEISGETNIDLKFGNGQIIKMINGLFNISYAEIKITEANQLNIISQSSQVYVDNIGLLKGQSRRDKYFLKKVNFFYCDSYFSDFNIEQLTNEISINSEYGSISIKKIEKSFRLLNIKSLYTDLDFIFAKGANYQLELTQQDVTLNLQPVSTIFKDEKIPNSQQIITTGTVGYGSNPSKARIEAKNCNVNITNTN